jgi:transcriptional regulator with XRE-family HTH domain
MTLRHTKSVTKLVKRRCYIHQISVAPFQMKNEKQRGPSMSTSSSKDTNDMDLIIGRRIRQCRQSQKMSQTKLANQVGIAWQQIQKYEGGKNRVSATMLWKIADVFDLPLSFFFQDMAEELGMGGDSSANAQWREARLMELYAQLGEDEKSAVFSFVKSVSMTGRVCEVAE